MPLKDIDAMMAEQTLDSSQRVAQRKLASEVVQIIHGVEEVKAVEARMGLLFKPSKTALRKAARGAIMDDNTTPAKPNSTDFNFLLNKDAKPDKPQAAGHVILPRSLVFSQQIGRILYACGLAASRSEGHRLSAAKGAYIGSLPGKQHGNMPDHVDFTPALNWEDDYVNRFVLDGKLLILRAGKWKVKIIKIVEDEEFERLGLDAPGWEAFKTERSKRSGKVDGNAGAPDGEAEGTKRAQSAAASS